MTSLTTTPLSTRFGVRVHGYAPAAELGSVTATALRGLLDEHKLLLFRGIPFEPEQQIALMGAFGPVIDEYGTGRKWLTLSNVDPESTIFPNYRLLFHQDYSFTPWPYPALSLYASEVVGGVARTEFASNRGGYLGLDAAERERFAALQVVLATPKARDRKSGDENNEGAPRTRIAPDDDLERYFRTEWPLVMRHPRTAEQMLFVTELFGSHIVGMGAADSEGVIEAIFCSLYRPDNQYAHDWELHDLLVWDNLALQHARGALEPSTRRTLRRVLVSVKERGDMLAASTGANGVG